MENLRGIAPRAALPIPAFTHPNTPSTYPDCHPHPPQVDSSGLLQFAAALNINLALVNILPLPGLDGAYLLLLLVTPSMLHVLVEAPQHPRPASPIDA